MFCLSGSYLYKLSFTELSVTDWSNEKFWYSAAYINEPAEAQGHMYGTICILCAHNVFVCLIWVAQLNIDYIR